MGISAAIGAAVVIGGTTAAVSANQQSIASQKQKDAEGDAQVANQKIVDNQTAADSLRKKQEDSATQQAFAETAATRTRNLTGASLRGAVPQQGIGSVGNASQSANKLIGS